MMFRTTRTATGDWQVKGLPFVIGKGPYAPKWGERQEWVIYDAANPDNLLAGGYWSKASAIDKLEQIAKGFGIDPR